MQQLRNTNSLSWGCGSGHNRGSYNWSDHGCGSGSGNDGASCRGGRGHWLLHADACKLGVVLVVLVPLADLLGAEGVGESEVRRLLAHFLALLIVLDREFLELFLPSGLVMVQLLL